MPSGFNIFYLSLEQWGIKGFLRTCSCFSGLPCCKALCSTSSNTVCDCGWLGENDHAYFGTDEERAEEEARERAMREAWANRILRERERQRILEGVKGGAGVLGNRVQGVGGVIGQRVHGVTERIPIGFFGHGGRTPRKAGVVAPPGVAGAVEGDVGQDLDKELDKGISTQKVGVINGPQRNSLLLGTGEGNLDDIIGGNRLRAPRPGSVVFDGTPGVEATPSVRRREGVRTGGSRSGGSGVRRNGSEAERSRSAATSRRDVRRETHEPALNRGTMASQTVVQRQYGPTAPMTIGSTLPHDAPPPAYM